MHDLSAEQIKLLKNSDAVDPHEKCFLFLDDVRDPPPGATLCRGADEAIRLIESGVVGRISFDHDLGTEKTGYDVAKRIEELVAEGRIDLPHWQVHSANPVGRRNIEAAMQSATRFARCR